MKFALTTHGQHLLVLAALVLVGLIIASFVVGSIVSLVAFLWTRKGMKEMDKEFDAMRDRRRYRPPFGPRDS